MDAGGAAGNGYAAVPVRRKSRKKTVDRKASKGRKIKYVTHPKMQNFMFPQVRFHSIKNSDGEGIVCWCWILAARYATETSEAPLCLPVRYRPAIPCLAVWLRQTSCNSWRC